MKGKSRRGTATTTVELLQRGWTGKDYWCVEAVLKTNRKIATTVLNVGVTHILQGDTGSSQMGAAASKRSEVVVNPPMSHQCIHSCKTGGDLEQLKRCKQCVLKCVVLFCGVSEGTLA